jgi:hypothetical protein
MAGKSLGTKVGDRFGSRRIVEFLPDRDSDGHLRCRWECDCGTAGTAGLKSLRHTQACTKCRNRNQQGRPTHGHAGRGLGRGRERTKLYDAWANMRQRANPDSASPRNQKWYVNRGITVCPEWQTFEPFRDWALANGWREGLSLDRVYNGGNYEPSNCEWVTKAENSRRAAQDEWRNHRDAPINALLSFGT